MFPFWKKLLKTASGEKSMSLNKNNVMQCSSWAAVRTEAVLTECESHLNDDTVRKDCFCVQDQLQWSSGSCTSAQRLDVDLIFSSRDSQESLEESNRGCWDYMKGAFDHWATKPVSMRCCGPSGGLLLCSKRVLALQWVCLSVLWWKCHWTVYFGRDKQSWIRPLWSDSRQNITSSLPALDGITSTKFHGNPISRFSKIHSTKKQTNKQNLLDQGKDSSCFINRRLTDFITNQNM